MSVMLGPVGSLACGVLKKRASCVVALSTFRCGPYDGLVMSFGDAHHPTEALLAIGCLTLRGNALAPIVNWVSEKVVNVWFFPIWLCNTSILLERWKQSVVMHVLT